MYPYFAEVPQILPLTLLITKPTLPEPFAAPPATSVVTAPTATEPFSGLVGGAWRYGPNGNAVVVPVAPEASVLLTNWVHGLAPPATSVLGSWSRCWSLYSSIWLRSVWSWLTRLFLRASCEALVN